MYTINELSKKSNAPADVVRFYARIGLIQPAAKQENGYRLFTSKDANRLRFIRIAKHLGFTLKEIKQITQHADLEVTPCEDVRKITQNRILENQIKIDELTKLQTRMESALNQWKLMPDGTPDGNHICHLIESIDNFGDKEMSKSNKIRWSNNRSLAEICETRSISRLGLPMKLALDAMVKQCKGANYPIDERPIIDALYA